MSSRREINRILVVPHPTDEDIGAREIDREHRDRGYLQIRYHFVIRRDGEVDAGRPVAKATKPAGSILIAWVGPEADHVQTVALQRLLVMLLEIHPDATVEGLPES